MTHQAFEGVQYVFLLHKAHLAVDLGELGLAVGAQVFIAEAAHDLVVAVVARHHQQLLEGLGRLGQGVELTRVHAAGHHKIAGAFWGGLDQVWGFHLYEIHAVQVLAGFQGQAVTQHHVFTKRATAQVQVAVFHADFLAAVGVVLDGEGRQLGRVQHLQSGDDNFNVAGRHVGVLAGTLSHGALHFDHVLAPEFARGLAEFGIGVHVEGQLGDAVTVAQVHEGHAAQVTGALDPSAEGHSLVHVLHSELSTSMRAVHGSGVEIAGRRYRLSAPIENGKCVRKSHRCA